VPRVKLLHRIATDRHVSDAVGILTVNRDFSIAATAGYVLLTFLILKQFLSGQLSLNICWTDFRHF